MYVFKEFKNIFIHTGEYAGPNGNKFTVENYASEINGVLTKIRGKWTGWAVMCEILRQSPRKMTIRPYLKAAESVTKSDTPNQAVANLLQNHNAVAGAAHWETAPPKSRSQLVCAGYDLNRPTGTKGTGEGSDTEVDFTASMFSMLNVPLWSGSEEVLLHEMVHGMRQMAGKIRCEATPDDPTWSTSEEFAAIVISNMFRSELGITVLRGTHQVPPMVNPTHANPQVFVNFNSHLPTSNLKRLQRLKSDHPKLYEDLKRSPAAFNPFKFV